MSLYQHAVEPGISLAGDRIRLVVESKISHDFGLRRIGGANLPAGRARSIRLVEIYRLSDVGGNHSIVLADLGYAIHLNGEQDGDAFFFQFSRQRDRLRSAPAVAEYDDARAAFFFGGESSIVVQIQAPQNLP